MALPTWVTQVAPAATAASTWASVAAVCPTDTTTPRPTRPATTSSAPGSSGARVTISTPESRDHEATRPADGAASQRSGWAPRRDGAISGPSKCRPSGHGPGPACGWARTGGPPGRGRAAEGSEVMTVGANAVTPYRASVAATSHRPVRVGGEVDAGGAVDLEVEQAGQDRQPARRRAPAASVGAAATRPPDDRDVPRRPGDVGAAADVQVAHRTTAPGPPRSAAPTAATG